MDELVNALRELSDWGTMDYEEDTSYASRIAKEAAKAIEELQKRVPKAPHGRLIDADALLNDKGVGTQIAGWGKMYHETAIEYAPTIIEAEGGE